MNEKNYDIKLWETYLERSVKLNIDSVLYKIYYNLAYAHHLVGDLLKADKFYKKSIRSSKQYNDSNILKSAYTSLGFLLKTQGKLDSAQYFYEQSLLMSDIENDKRTVSTILNNIGQLYTIKGDVATALNYHHQALKLREELNDSLLIANSLNNIAADHKSQGNDSLGKVYMYKSLKIYEQKKDPSLGDWYWNYALFITNEKDSSLFYFKKSAEAYKKLKSEYGDGNFYYVQGVIFERNEMYDSVIVSFKKVIPVFLKFGYKEYVARAYTRMAFAERQLKNYTNSIKYADSAYTIANKGGFVSSIASSTEELYLSHKASNSFKEAMKYYEIHIFNRDSINNEKTQKASIRQQTQYEFEKEQLIKEQKQKEESRKLKEETERRNNIQYSIIFIAILAFFGAILSLGFIKVSPKFAEGLIFFAFLIFFEFLLVLSDPFVDGLTGGEPIYKLLLNAMLAALIFPLHAFFERYLKSKLIKKNKAI